VSGPSGPVLGNLNGVLWGARRGWRRTVYVTVGFEDEVLRVRARRQVPICLFRVTVRARPSIYLLLIFRFSFL
jgi:hypothetical protein